jgi:hypothetical protein
MFLNKISEKKNPKFQQYIEHENEKRFKRNQNIYDNSSFILKSFLAKFIQSHFCFTRTILKITK